MKMASGTSFVDKVLDSVFVPSAVKKSAKTLSFFDLSRLEIEMYETTYYNVADPAVPAPLSQL